MRAQATKPFFITVGFSDPHRAEENFGNTRAWPDVPRITYNPAEVRIPAHLPDLPAVRDDRRDFLVVIRGDGGEAALVRNLRENLRRQAFDTGDGAIGQRGSGGRTQAQQESRYPAQPSAQELAGLSLLGCRARGVEIRKAPLEWPAPRLENGWAP